jgi:hypothetical protein
VSCPSGQLGFSSQLIDFLQCTTINGATVTALDPNGVPYQATSAISSGDGAFGLCLPQDSPFTLEANAATYPTAYVAELQGVQAQNITQVGMVSSEFLTAFASFFPGGLDLALGTVIVKVNTSKQCSQAQAGWTVGIDLPDGGSLPDGGYQLVYTSSTGVPTSGLTSTQLSGGAIFYDIDPTLSDFFEITYQNPDAGGCTPTNASFGFTGRVYVTGSAVSGFPIQLH